MADKEADYFAVAFDRAGKLGWKGPKILDEDPGYDNAHIIEVLCENVSDAYLAYLKSIGVSYIFAGEKEMDIPLALTKLKELFGIEKMLLEGGSIINGAFQKEDMVDEISLVMAPLIGQSDGKPLFYESEIKGYNFIEAKVVSDSVIWLKYAK